VERKRLEDGATKETSSGKHPAELEKSIAELIKAIQEKVETESLDAALPLRLRWAQLEDDLAKKRLGQERVESTWGHGPMPKTREHVIGQSM
jgi:hypothetical protein